MATDVDRIAEVLAAHDWINLMTLECRCGEQVLPTVADGVRIRELLSAHQSEQLTAAGWVSPDDVAHIKAEAEETVGRKYAAMYERQRQELQADVWDEALGEAYSCGWLHGGALVDMKARNPYRAAAATEAKP